MNFLIVGKAKSGTTIISKTIQKSAGVEEYHLEKRTVQFFDNTNRLQPMVVKLLFEDWAGRLNFLRGICGNEAKIKFGKVVCIVRDPRDVLVSLILFRSAQILSTQENKDVDQWIRFLIRKESDPASLSIRNMFNELSSITGKRIVFENLVRAFVPWFNFARDAKRLGAYCLRYEDFINGNHHRFQEYLGFELTKDRKVDNYINTPRTRGINNWKEFLLEEDLSTIDDLIGKRMRHLGYGDWKATLPTNLSPEFYSGYVRRVIGNIRDRQNERGADTPRAISLL